VEALAPPAAPVPPLAPLVTGTTSPHPLVADSSEPPRPKPPEERNVVQSWRMRTGFPDPVPWTVTAGGADGGAPGQSLLELSCRRDRDPASPPAPLDTTITCGDLVMSWIVSSYPEPAAAPGSSCAAPELMLARGCYTILDSVNTRNKPSTENHKLGILIVAPSNKNKMCYSKFS